MKTVVQKTNSRAEVTQAIHRIMQKIAPDIKGAPPFFTVSLFDKKRMAVSFFLVTLDQPRVGSFFYEMVSRSLPGKITLFFLAPTDENYIAAEIEMVFKSAWEWEEHRGQVELLRHELLIGLRSLYHARRILEIKGMSVEDKRIQVQEKIAQMVRRFPNRFDYDFFSLLQHFFLHAHRENFHFHEVRQISENLSGLYQIKKKLIELIEKDSKTRHLKVKIRKRRLHLPFGTKNVLGISVGITLLREHEVFSIKHLTRALRTLVPEGRFFNESAYLYEDTEYPLLLLYLEIETDQQAFLMRELPLALKGRVEHLQRPLFMPRNEEEVMRHVVTLGGQLKFSRDLPQVIISFHGQDDKQLQFTLILARILLPHVPSAEAIETGLSSLCPQLERVKKIGMIRKKYFKEAIVLKVGLPLEAFIREDQSVDLYRGRLHVLNELEKVVGEVRDYNGGMISKQNEVLHSTLQLLGEKGKQHRLLFDHFFYSLFPVEKRSLIDPFRLKTLFLMLLGLLESKKHQQVKTMGDVFYLIAEVKDQKKWADQLEHLPLSSRPVTLELSYDDRFFVGLILECNESLQKEILHILRF